MAADASKASIMRGMEAKAHVYRAVARTTASISLVATLSIILSYLLSPRFRKPMNRILFYASLGNIFQATALFICTSGLPLPGKTMSLCRFQGFCIQMFTTSAVMWTLAMALNVYLIYFRKFDTAQLRRLEPWYIAINYGWPFGHTFVLLMLDVSPKQTGIFGPAVMWCWISTDYEWMRLAFSYGPTWVIIIIVTAIFAVTGISMIRCDYEMRKLHRGADAHVTLLDSQDNGAPYIPSNQIMRVTDIHLSSVIPEPNYSSSAVTGDLDRYDEEQGHDDDNPLKDDRRLARSPPTVTATTAEEKKNKKRTVAPRLKLPPKVRLPPGVHVRLEDYATTAGGSQTRSHIQSLSSMLAQPRRSPAQSFGSAHASFGSTAAWPFDEPAPAPASSMGKRGFAVVHAGSSCAQQTLTTCTANNDNNITTANGNAMGEKGRAAGPRRWARGVETMWKRQQRRRRRGAAMAARRALRDRPRAGQALDAAWAYAKVAFLMFIGLIVIWVPASANRIYSLVKGTPSPLFTVMHAAVGPMQGFLHWLIYIATSWPQVRSVLREMRQSFRERYRKQRT